MWAIMQSLINKFIVGSFEIIFVKINISYRFPRLAMCFD
jgi:hypothetical protein